MTKIIILNIQITKFVLHRFEQLISDCVFSALDIVFFHLIVHVTPLNINRLGCL